MGGSAPVRPPAAERGPDFGPETDVAQSGDADPFLLGKTHAAKRNPEHAPEDSDDETVDV